MCIFYLLYAMLLFTPRYACYDYDDYDDDSDRAENLLQSQITVTSWNDMPYSGIVQENGEWVGKGYAFYIFNIISTKLNFTYTIIPPKEHILGDEKSGVLGLLNEKKAEVAVAFLPVLPEMRRYCSFGASLDETRLTAVMKRPQVSATGSGLLAPFETTVWLLVLASLISIGPIIYIFAKIRKLWNDPTSENFTLSSCLWFAYSSLLKQGSEIIAITDTTRILFATWWIFILILTSFYTANLTAFLTKPQFTLSISSIQDIVYMGYTWITFKGRIVDFLLSQDHQNDLSLLNVSKWQGKGIFKYYEPSKDILDAVSTKRLFLAESHYLQTLLFQDYLNKTRNRLDHNLRCTYVIMPEAILTTNRAFAFSHDSPTKKYINRLLRRLVETGIVQHRKEEDLPLAEICPVDLRSSERQLQNTDLLLTYEVVVAGYAIATIIFLFEIICACISCRVKNRKVKHRSRVPKEKSQNHSSKNLSIEKRSNSPVNNPGAENLMIQGKQQFFNGRNYYVITDQDGDRRLIPIRTPSAFLFQYVD
ncbi:glutamate receptor ionotropic, delta-1 isoform X2 [Osmia bicornis bicornis]|uniref:glutamate receptor ionotropic, delta-1 isoform X2 n=1 Tax=Osmia bicornis bicornis TaxID=1437191 RepID=UPI001EAF799B|nr:glutamate receptor ionotropic, delta-1 isoform X2 [Osmia bicornis bicornis]